MLFNSYEFIFAFAPVVLSLFYIIAKLNSRAAIAWITISSLFFYGWWDPKSLLIILASMTVNYLLGFSIINNSDRETTAHRKNYLLLVLGIIFNLSLLGYFKYSHFFKNQWNWLLGIHETSVAMDLPLGISFFSFVQIAFLVDAYRREKMKYDALEYFFFVTYFPHLIAGPIIHHSDVIPKLKAKETFRFQSRNISIGVFLFAVGLFKKTVLADRVALFVSPAFDHTASISLNIFEAWIAAIAYTLQIYFDISAYSDMALGISKMLNI